GQKPDRTRPISRLNIRSFVTSHADHARVPAGKPLQLRGIAFNAGAGIARVLVSADGGQTWQEARLGADLGRYSFREWQLALALPRGPQRVM
ncbi:oxidase, partial [Acinetobacter baumannii]